MSTPTTASRWATRRHIKIDRAACVWLIRKFIDPSASIDFVPDEDIAGLTNAGVLTFDAEHARFRHRVTPEAGKYTELCTFQVLAEHYDLQLQYPDLLRMGSIVWAADIGHHIHIYEPKEGFGLWCVALGMSLTSASDIEIVARQLPVFDAVYAYCQNHKGSQQ